MNQALPYNQRQRKAQSFKKSALGNSRLTDTDTHTNNAQLVHLYLFGSFRSACAQSKEAFCPQKIKLIIYRFFQQDFSQTLLLVFSGSEMSNCTYCAAWKNCTNQLTNCSSKKRESLISDYGQGCHLLWTLPWRCLFEAKAPWEWLEPLLNLKAQCCNPRNVIFFLVYLMYKVRSLKVSVERHYSVSREKTNLNPHIWTIQTYAPLTGVNGGVTFWQKIRARYK